MKTDTENTVRVTITFNSASNPEWYDVIRGIKSGRARSEIVKAHLSVPSLERFGQNRRIAQAIDQETVIFTENKKINSGTSIINSYKFSPVDVVKVSQENELRKINNSTLSTPDLDGSPIQRKQSGGLASHLVGYGFKSV